MSVNEKDVVKGEDKTQVWRRGSKLLLLCFLIIAVVAGVQKYHEEIESLKQELKALNRHPSPPLPQVGAAIKQPIAELNARLSALETKVGKMAALAHPPPSRDASREGVAAGGALATQLDLLEALLICCEIEERIVHAVPYLEWYQRLEALLQGYLASDVVAQLRPLAGKTDPNLASPLNCWWLKALESVLTVRRVQPHAALPDKADKIAILTQLKDKIFQEYQAFAEDQP